MHQTTESLSELRAHWKASGSPSITQLAKAANVPSATAHRYLTGATKGGIPETIRALAIAMGRDDIADSLPYTGFAEIHQKDDYITEMDLIRQERAAQHLAEVTAKHKQEMDDLIRDHRIEREAWRMQCQAMHEENTNLRASFDSAVSFRDTQLRFQRIEKYAFLCLLVIAVVALILK